MEFFENFLNNGWKKTFYLLSPAAAYHATYLSYNECTGSWLRVSNHKVWMSNSGGRIPLVLERNFEISVFKLFIWKLRVKVRRNENWDEACNLVIKPPWIEGIYQFSNEQHINKKVQPQHGTCLVSNIFKMPLTTIYIPDI